MEPNRSHLNPDGPPELFLFDDPDADIILCSCDLREFRILKLYITKSSPVLGDLIRSSTIDSSDSSTSSRSGGLPSVQISETGDILSSLLSFILPVSPDLPPTTEKIMELLSVAQKYKMNSTLAHIRGAIALRDPPFIRPDTAFRIFSLARKYGLDQEVVSAARMALAFPMTIQGMEDKFDAMHGTDLYVLWKYYQSIQINLRSDLQAFRMYGASNELAGLTCGIDNDSDSIPFWMDTYIASIEEEPAFFSLYDFHSCLYDHLRNSECNCGDMTTRDAFWKALTTVVNNSMAKVSMSEHKIHQTTNEALISPQCEQDLLREGQAELRSHPNSEPRGSASPRSGNGHLDPPHADVIIQSSDLVTFRVNKVTLSVSSPFFADMFSLPQPSESETIDGLPVVRLSEDAEILNSLLTMLYPVPSVVPASYDKALELLTAAQKYDMAGIRSSIRTEIKSWGRIVLTGTVAYRAYAISSSARLFPETETSARHTLDFPMTLEYLSNDLPLFAGWALRDLVRYRKRCRDNLLTALRSCFFSAALGIWAQVECTGAANMPYHHDDPFEAVEIPLPNGVFPDWLQDMFSGRIEELQGSFTDPFPKPSSIREAYLAALNTHISSEKCHSCATVHALEGERFCVEMEGKLARALDKVSTLS